MKHLNMVFLIQPTIDCRLRYFPLLILPKTPREAMIDNTTSEVVFKLNKITNFLKLIALPKASS